MRLARTEALLAALWAGMLLCIATLATPAPFATLPLADAGRVVGRMFAQEAYTSLVAGVLLVVMERRRSRDREVGAAGSAFSAEIMLTFGAIFCTVAGYFAVQPLMAAARAGQGAMSFGALHAVSLGFFALKGLLVLVLAWRLGGRAAPVTAAAAPS